MTSIGAKVAHVKAAPNTGDHHCHWPGCTVKVKPAMWGCTRHWYMLPAWLRSQIWQAYRPGQEEAKNPSGGYVAVARRAQDWIEEYERTHPPASRKQGSLF